jgi:hypothetical protein
MWVELSEPPEGSAFRRASSCVPLVQQATGRAIKAQVSRIAELERSDGIVEAIDPVLVSIFAMVTHPADKFCRNIAGRNLHDALVWKAAVH